MFILFQNLINLFFSKKKLINFYGDYLYFFHTNSKNSQYFQKRNLYYDPHTFENYR